mgnify:CR=1 FL=1
MSGSIASAAGAVEATCDRARRRFTPDTGAVAGVAAAAAAAAPIWPGSVAVKYPPLPAVAAAGVPSALGYSGGGEGSGGGGSRGGAGDGTSATAAASRPRTSAMSACVGASAAQRRISPNAAAALAAQPGGCGFSCTAAAQDDMVKNTGTRRTPSTGSWQPRAHACAPHCSVRSTVRMPRRPSRGVGSKCAGRLRSGSVRRGHPSSNATTGWWGCALGAILRQCCTHVQCVMCCYLSASQ